MHSNFARTGLRWAGALAIATTASGALAQLTATTTAGTLSGAGQVTVAAPQRYPDVVLAGDKVSGTYTFAPLDADVGKQVDLYVVAQVAEGDSVRWFSLAQDRWVPWSGNTANLPAATTRVLGTTETIDFLRQQALFAGEYSLYAGYRTSGSALRYAGTPLNFAVQSTDGEALHRFSSAAAMEAWLKAGLQATTTAAYYSGIRGPAFATDVAASVGSSIVPRTSTTNLQETGVDEADTIKVTGNRLYALKNCDLEPCLEVYDLDSSNATSSLVTSYKLGNTQGPDGMYLVESGILGQRMLVTIAGRNQFWNWFSIRGWQEGKTELEFLNVSTPASISSIEKLTLDGALVASRRVGDMLYVVTRYTPAIDGFYPFPVAKDQEVANATSAGRKTRSRSGWAKTAPT